MGFRAVALSSGSSKETLARSLGAQEYIDGSKVDQAAALQALGGAKVIMCTAPNSEVMGKLLPGLAIDGTLLFIALAIEPITLAPGKLAPVDSVARVVLMQNISDSSTHWRPVLYQRMALGARGRH